MLKQIKYSMRENLNQRMFAIIGTIILNVVFGVIGQLYGSGWQITAVTFSSLSLTAMIIIFIIADAKSIGSLFSAPEGYNIQLAPIPGWKVLLGKIIPIVVFDLIGLAIGIIGVVIQSFFLTNIEINSYNSDLKMLWWYIPVVIVNYFLLITLIFFGCAASKSLFYSMKPRKLLGTAGFFIMLYILSLPEYLLTLASPFTRQGFFFMITVYTGFNAGMIGYLILCIAKSAALFFVTTYLYERKVNL